MYRDNSENSSKFKYRFWSKPLRRDQSTDRAGETGPADPATAGPIFSVYLITIHFYWYTPPIYTAKQPKLDNANR